MKTRIRILIADDHPVVRQGLAACLERHDHLAVVGEARDGFEAVALCRERKPDLVLMDIAMPRMSGLAAAEMLRKEMPQIRVLILTMHSNKDYVQRVLQCGAAGYVLKDASPEDLVLAIEAVYRGEPYFSPEIAGLALDQFVRGPSGELAEERLTCREREVLIQIADGFSNKEIASRLGVGVRTVETHRERIMRKLDIHSVAGLTKYALARGLVGLDPELKS
jgi:two-component system nitrate/nitrite response regulator NarL